MYQSLKLKSVALEGGLVSLLTAMWPSCTVSVPLARAVLDMLTVFTARNDKGLCVCVCVCVRACRACVRACVCVRAFVHMCDRSHRRSIDIKRGE